MERYTLLVVTGDGIVLHDYHRRRLDPGGDAAAVAAFAAAFARFAREARPGVFAVRVGADGALRAESREGSRLREGMRARLLVSPLAGRQGTVPKPAAPSPYDAVRADGVATLLTSADGSEIYEACVAAVLGWDGERLVCVPGDRPRVWSTAEAAVREHLPVREAPLAVRARTPLLLVNAVRGTCEVALQGRDAFPAGVRAELERLFRSLVGPGAKGCAT